MNLRSVVAIILLLSTVHLAHSGERSAPPPMANSDVVKLVNGGMNKDFIIHTIQSSPNRFDLSVDALLELKKKGVPDDIIQAMMSPQQIKPADSKETAKRQDEEDDSFWLYDDLKKTRMEVAHMEVDTRVGLRALVGVGYGYATFPESGPAATLRLRNKIPTFGELAVPLDRRVAELVFLVKLETDPETKQRRVQVAKASLFSGNDQGFPQEVRIPVEFKDVGETTMKGKRMRMYRMTPSIPLEPGEYAVVISMNYFFDFGIDP